MRKILLVNPVENDGFKRLDTYPSGALILIGTMLLNKGHDVRIVHMASDRMHIDGLKSMVASFRPEIVGVTVNTFQTKSAKQITAAVKEVDRDITVVVGGPHPSALGMSIFSSFPHVDISVVGEGEHTFMEIVDGTNLKDIKGICYEGGDNGSRDVAKDLDYIPLPNLDAIDMRNFTGSDPLGAYPSMFLMASRGCPFQCTFCNKSVFGHHVRFRKPEAVVAEIEWLYKRYGIREVYFQDDTFNLNRGWTERVLQLIIESGLNKRLVYKVAFRANKNLVDADLLRLAKQAGVWLVFYGVESGNQDMLNSISKGLTVAEIRRAFDLTHKAGLKTIGAFIVGLPGETEATFSDTLRLWSDLRPHFTGCGAAIPVPKTELDTVVTRKGHKLITDYDEYSLSKVVVRTDALSAEQLTGLLLRFRRLVAQAFLLDLLMLRHIRILLMLLRSPQYLKHMLRRLATYFKV